MTLWDWAGRCWDRPGVGEACLTLQNDHGQCIPLLLWGLWRWECGDGLDDEAVGQAAALCRAMDDMVIAPLRAERRAASPADRERLLANELKVEHELLDRLAALPAGEPDRRTRSAGDMLSTVSSRWGAALGASAFDDLLAALSVQEPADVG